MSKHRFVLGSHISPRLLAALLVLCVLCVVIFSLLPTMQSFSSKNAARQTQAIEEIITRALVQCYALEGSYPPSIEYLAEHYKIILSENYYYHYELTMSNVRPLIKVVPKGGPY